MRKLQDRAPDGQYTFDGRLDRVCVCGHTLGDHAAVSPHECFVHTLSDREIAERFTAADKQCRCPKFRPSKKRNPQPLKGP